MSGTKSRNKGHTFERRMSTYFKDIFPTVCTARFESKKLDNLGVDLAFTPKFNFQCKAVERLSPSYHDILKTMPLDDNINVILHKKNHKGIVAVLDLKDFKNILIFLKEFGYFN